METTKYTVEKYTNKKAECK